MITRVELQQYRRTTDHHRRSPENKAFRRRLEEALKGMPSELRRLIVFRYCLRLSWVAVALRMHYSERQVYRLDRIACKELEKAE